MVSGPGRGRGVRCQWVCLAWPPCMVTLFTELGEAHKEWVWEDRKNQILAVPHLKHTLGKVQ